MSARKNEYRSPWKGSSQRPAYTKGTAPPRKSGGGHGIRIAVILIAVLMLAVAGASAYFYFSSLEGPNISLEFSKPARVLLGETFTLAVSFSNHSDRILRNARISLLLPEGVSFVGQSRGQRVAEQAVGDLGPGSINQESFDLIVTDGSNSLKRIQARLGYSAGGKSSAQYESSAEIDLLIGEPAVNLTLSAPQNIFNDQDFEIKIDYANNTSRDFKNLRLKVDYPPIFQFERSTMQPEGISNNLWDLGTLAAGSGGTISITGSVIGAERSFFSFKGSLLADFLGSTYTINTQTASVAISSVPLSLELELNNSTDYVARLGDALNYVLRYRNNSDVVMQNATIRARLIGELFDFQTLKTEASFNSLSNTATWFAANTPQLTNIAPGQSGSVKLDVRLKDFFPIRLISDKNFTLRLEAQIESPTVPPNTTAKRTISIASMENKVAGKLEIVAEAYWRDAASGILNSGPYPPIVNQPTQYTIHWRVRNYATDVTNIVISGFLQSGSRFTGNVKSNIESVPSYNPNSGLVTWRVNSLPATKGVISRPAEAIFQIETIPALNQIGQNIPLLSETKVEGVDSFVGLTFRDTAPALDTSLPHDKTITVSDRRVQQ